MALIRITRYWDSTVLHDIEATDQKAALQQLVSTDANLTDADLTGADLTGADLRGANLRGANLRGADLTGADLTGANLTGADLRGANLTGADLTGANLRSIRDDLWAVLSGAPAEVPGLLAALKAGEVNGSNYSGACARLVGTLANVRGCRYDQLAPVVPNSGRPAEVWFMQIQEGATPENNQAAKLAAEWIAEWLARMRATFAPSAAPDTTAAVV